MVDVRTVLQEVFQDVFENPELEIREDMDANSIEEWDSLQHINLIIATEKAFSIRFSTAEIARLKQPGENVGSFVALLERKLQATAGGSKRR